MCVVVEFSTRMFAWATPICTTGSTELAATTDSTRRTTTAGVAKLSMIGVLGAAKFMCDLSEVPPFRFGPANR